MVGTVLLGVFLLISTYTDVRWRIIHNRTTYTGLIVGLAAGLWASILGVDAASATPRIAAWWGLVSVGESFSGMLACGAAMLVCYVLFAGGVGGGDLKLISMMGAWLGVYRGLEAMLWTMVIAGGMAVIILVWRVGFWSLAARGWRYLWTVARGNVPVLTDEDRKSLKTELFLSPSALIAVVIVRFELLDYLAG